MAPDTLWTAIPENTIRQQQYPVGLSFNNVFPSALAAVPDINEVNAETYATGTGNHSSNNNMVQMIPETQVKFATSVRDYQYQDPTRVQCLACLAQGLACPKVQRPGLSEVQGMAVPEGSTAWTCPTMAVPESSAQDVPLLGRSGDEPPDTQDVPLHGNLRSGHLLCPEDLY